MTLYCGIDLHATNHLVVIIDDEDRRVLEKRLVNDVSITVDTLGLYRDQLAGIAVESTFNWYWLIDGLEDAGFVACLANPAAIKQYEGLKHTDDPYDAFFLAHLMRLGILPTGYIYPREQRGVRDLLRSCQMFIASYPDLACLNRTGMRSVFEPQHSLPWIFSV